MALTDFAVQPCRGHSGRPRRPIAPLLFVEGRLDDVIVRGGENISPGEIEDVLRLHPQVRDVAVYGLPDDNWGEKVGCSLVCEGAPSKDELAQWVQARLRSTKTPEAWDFAAARPGLVWIAITGHGWTGPGAQRAGFGDDAAVAGGLVDWAGDEPRFAGDALADPLTGLAAALADLDAMQRGGGVLVDVSLAVTAACAAQAARSAC